MDCSYDEMTYLSFADDDCKITISYRKFSPRLNKYRINDLPKWKFHQKKHLLMLLQRK